MNQTQFLNKYRALQTPANVELREVLRLWLVESKSDLEIAKALGKTDRTTGGRKIVEICKHFGTDTKGKKEQRQQLVLLFRRYCSDFEVHSSLYPDWVEPNLIVTKPENIVSDIVPITPIASTEFDLLGRDADRQKLAELSQKHKLVLLKAAAGIGKSILAKEFLRTHFTRVIEINMALSPDDNAPASERLPIILKELGEDTTDNFGLNLEALKRRLLDKSQPPIAFLLDNLEPALDSDFKFLEKLRDYEGLLQVLGDRDVCSFTLITSRLELIVQRVNVHLYSLQGLDIEVWRKHFHDCENGATSEALEKMCVAYNGNAKVMDILHGAITNRFDGNIAAYWNRYKDALLADAELETLISMEMDWLRDNQSDAYNLLCRMGCYRYQDVKTVPFEGLLCLLWDVPESQRVGVIDYLSKTSLIEVKGEYYLHPTVREITRNILFSNTEQWNYTNIEAARFWKSTTKLIKSIRDAFKAFESYYHYIVVTDFLSAANIIIQPIGINNEVNGQEASLGTIFFRFGLLGYIISAIQELIPHISFNSFPCLRLYNLLGNHFSIEGKVRSSISCHQKCIEIASFINDQLWLMNSHINIGYVYMYLWELENADRCFTAALRIMSSLPSIFSRLGTYVYTAAILAAQKKHKEAILQLDKVLANIPIPTISRYEEAFCLVRLGKTYIDVLEIDKAEQVLFIAISYADQGSFPHVKGKAFIVLSQVYRIKGNLKESLDLLENAISILSRVGIKCESGEAYLQLGLTYQAMREHAD